MADLADCPICKMRMDNEAEAFIHDRLHNGGPEWAEWGAWGKLNQLPFILFPIVGRLMEAYRARPSPDRAGGGDGRGS